MVILSGQERIGAGCGAVVGDGSDGEKMRARWTPNAGIQTALYPLAGPWAPGRQSPIESQRGVEARPHADRASFPPGRPLTFRPQVR